MVYNVDYEATVSQGPGHGSGVRHVQHFHAQTPGQRIPSAGTIPQFRCLGTFRGGVPHRMYRKQGSKLLATAPETYHAPSARDRKAGIPPVPERLANQPGILPCLRPCTVPKLICRRWAHRPCRQPFSERRRAMLSLVTLNVQGLNPYRADNRVKLATLIEQARRHRWDIVFV